MDPVNPLPAIAALLVAYVTSSLIAQRYGAPSVNGRFASIDGLRGYLAFCVFLHHSSIWYYYLRMGKWAVPPSNLYTQLGQCAIALFFMITGFLFFSKLIDGRVNRIDWLRLFVSRFLRIVPIYVLVITLLSIVVAILADGSLNEPIPKLIGGLVSWLTFTITGSPDLNGVVNTGIIVARVTWSLPYEWMFYLSLPLLALLVGVMPPIWTIVLSVASVWYFRSWHPTFHDLSFLCGIATALIARSDRCRSVAVRKASSLIAIGCTLVAVTAFPSVYEVIPFALIAVSFMLVACGNSLFGLLLSPVSRTLGDYSYGIYLLHGITLFATFHFVVGVPASAALSSMQHWLIILGLIPILIFASFVCYRVIEHPAMQATATVTAWLRRQFMRSPWVRPGGEAS